jgi:hypothetical protein
LLATTVLAGLTDLAARRGARTLRSRTIPSRARVGRRVQGIEGERRRLAAIAVEEDYPEEDGAEKSLDLHCEFPLVEAIEEARRGCPDPKRIVA